MIRRREMRELSEERLTNIESGIARLGKMQTCVFDMLLILRRISEAAERPEQALTSVERVEEYSRQRQDRGIVLIFGAIAVISLIISGSLFFADGENRVIGVMLLAFSFVALGLILLGIRELYRSWRYWQMAGRRLAELDGIVERVNEDETAINNTLARILAEWKELAPDDSTSEFRNGAAESNDSHGRS
jgi:hypothetical protein